MPEPRALEEVRLTLGYPADSEQSLERARLIEYLHLLQDRFGQLEARHLVALADLMHLAPAEVYEVATFYAHFEVVADGAEAPRLTVRVCDSLSCELAGSTALHAALADGAPKGVRVVRAPCMGRCDTAPAVALDHTALAHARAEPVLGLVRRRLAELETAAPPESDAVPSAILHAHAAPEPAPEGAQRFAAYRAQGGYDFLERCLAGEVERAAVLARVEESGLRGMGGAGFPVARKWQAVGQESAPRYLTVNADEGEPGTFKDLWCMARDPHRVLEGMLLAAWAVGCERAYFYLRDEYPEIRTLLLEELEAVAASGLAAHCPIELRRGAGAYICGEESAMIESIEGKRGLPRHRPPYIAQVGLFGRPTLNHNVESLWWLPEILDAKEGWFASHGANGRKGLRLFSVSGRVAEPGVKRAPAGIGLNALVAEYCGGMASGHSLAGYLPGGASGGILPASLADLPLDFDTLQPHGCFIGSAAVIVLSNQDDLRAAARNLLRFFADESCGQCTPCRNGTEKMVQLMSADSWNRPLLDDLARVMADASICGLGQAAANPVLSLYRHFPETFAPDGA